VNRKTPKRPNLFKYLAKRKGPIGWYGMECNKKPSPKRGLFKSGYFLKY
jgi:hypothetical protein